MKIKELAIYLIEYHIIIDERHIPIFTVSNKCHLA